MPAWTVQELMVSGRKATPMATLGVPRPLLDDVDLFIAEHPEYGIKHRNDFATRAIGDMLRELRKEVHERLAVEAFKAGKPGPLDQLRRSRR